MKYRVVVVVGASQIGLKRSSLAIKSAGRKMLQFLVGSAENVSENGVSPRAEHPETVLTII